ncbi:hypothetical protein MJO48_07255 [Dickeya fangzhongdai]|uniref:glycosyl hydrolase family 28-related protein n=1 Tax=Dickeya fangzhongdai TaxID=1778540 RepID=UPI001EFA379A|nr:glycosyl hydrolase family 28-related protein [Dickeya fangzhongdai]ULR32472.1 hypothetical protein MJO48_07255 [Dickeya fangzhongdai]
MVDLFRRQIIGFTGVAVGAAVIPSSSFANDSVISSQYPVNPLKLGWSGGREANDDSLLQKIINRHSSVMFPPGDYLIGNMEIPHSSLICGNGYSTRIKKKNGADCVFIFSNGNSMMHSKMRDIAFVGGGGIAIINEAYRTDIDGVYFSGYEECFLNSKEVGEWKIRNSTIENCTFGIVSKKGGINSEINITAANCHSAIYIDNTNAQTGAEGILLHRCLIYKSGVEGSDSKSAIFIKNADYARLQNVMSDKNYGTALHIENSKYVDEYGGYYASNNAKLKTPSVVIKGDCSDLRLRGRAEYSPYYALDATEAKGKSSIHLDELMTRKGTMGGIIK